MNVNSFKKIIIKNFEYFIKKKYDLSFFEIKEEINIFNNLLKGITIYELLKDLNNCLFFDAFFKSLYTFNENDF